MKEPPPALYAGAMPLATTSWGQRPVSPGAGGMALAHHEGPGCRLQVGCPGCAGMLATIS